MTVEKSLFNKSGFKSVPLKAADGYPAFDMSIRDALKSQICPIVTVTSNNGVGLHAMCAHTFDSSTKEIVMKNSDEKWRWIAVPITRGKLDERSCREAFYIKFDIKLVSLFYLNVFI